MTYLLLFVLFYLGYTSAILLRNRFSFRPAGVGARDLPVGPSLPKIGVCIPARNEESVIERCVSSVLRQQYAHFEVLVLNDGSTDRTGELLRGLQQSGTGSALLVIDGEPRPSGWLGKPWACQQLAQSTDADILLFLDADTWLEPGALTSISQEFHSGKSDAITIWPRQVLGTFQERTIIPLVYFALLTLLPSVYVRRDPRWMPAPFRRHFRGLFAAACGQCIAFTRTCYEGIGGHNRVRDQVVEDVELAKVIKKDGFRLSMHHGIGQVNCRMYENPENILPGFRKNFLAGFGHHVPFFVAAALLHLLVFVFPYGTLVYSLLSGDTVVLLLSASAVGSIHVQRGLLDRWNGWSVAHGFTHILGVLWFQRLGWIVLWDRIRGRRVQWKGRDIQP